MSGMVTSSPTLTHKILLRNLVAMIDVVSITTLHVSSLLEMCCIAEVVTPYYKDAYLMTRQKWSSMIVTAVFVVAMLWA